MLKDIKLINFIDCSLEQKKMILLWRNNPVIKKWMYTQENISLESHLAFIDSLKDKTESLYFLVQKQDDNLGVIDFTQIKKDSLHMGLYINPQLKGLGKVFMELIIFYSFEVLSVKKIIAEVFLENEKARLLYNNFNFKEVDEKIVNGKKVKCLELKYENR